MTRSRGGAIHQVVRGRTVTIEVDEYLQRPACRIESMTDSITVVDLFSGCGGLSLGFQMAGVKPIAAFDSWKPAVDTYNTNFDHRAELVELHSGIDLPSSTIIAGGPPCQGFSSAGLRRDDDERNTLVHVFADLVSRHLPEAFVFENVEGFLTGSKGQFVVDLLEPVIEAGYRVRLQKINAAHYGVPQHRKRVIAVGGLGWDPVIPPHSSSALGAPGARLANDHSLPFTPTIEEALAGLGEPEEVNGKSTGSGSLDHYYTQFNEADLNRARHMKPGQRMHDLPEELWHGSYKKRAYRRVMDGTPTERRGGAPAGLRRLSADEPSKAITSGALRDFVHPTEDRPLTIRECARLQTFPDSFTFVGNKSDKILMIGNAVPVRLAEAIARSLVADLHARRPRRQLPGALVGFVPTLSNGMSPALQHTCDIVRESFMLEDPPEQATLCL